LITNILNFYNKILYNNLLLTKKQLIKFLNSLNFSTFFLSLNSLILQEGLFVDFLQKKVTDNWIKKFFTHASYLFNEKYVFDCLIRFYLNLVILPLTLHGIFEYKNVSNLLFVMIFFLSLFLFFIFFIFLFFYVL